MPMPMPTRSRSPMAARATGLAAALGWLFAASLPAQRPGALFDRVVEALEDRLLPGVFADGDLENLARGLRPAAAAATSRGEERGVVQALLQQVPVSHLALLSNSTHRRFEDELMGHRAPTLGCALLQLGGRFYVDAVLDGGPAARAGLRRGDEVLLLDGVPAGHSPLLDWRCDDAFLADPPTHELRVGGDQAVTMRVVDAAAAEGIRDVSLRAARWSGLAASVAGVREIELDGQRVLYLHLWFVFHGQSGRLLATARRDHPDCSALLLDLRGRGGSALECDRVLREVLRAADDGLPTVALVDARTRSAKEVIASELQRRGVAVLVGEPTAGAVLPASFVAVDDDAVLMLPESRLGEQSRALEGKGVRPEVRAADPLPAVPGSDPILDAGLRVVAEILASGDGHR